jgi:hypothetical protein
MIDCQHKRGECSTKRRLLINLHEESGLMIDLREESG